MPGSENGQRGFSIVELACAIAILVILTCLALPPLAEMRARANQTLCLARIREASCMVTLYCDASRDWLPFAGREVHDIQLEGVADSTMHAGGDAGLSHGTWSYLFPEEWSGDRWNRGLTCPRQPAHKAGARSPEPGFRMTPTYELVASSWFAWYCLTPTTGFDDLVPAPNKLGDVWFPSQKVMLWEQPSYCATGPGAAAWIAIHQTQNIAGSNVMFDGSAARLVPDRGQPGVGLLLPHAFTIGGVRGRDLP